MEKKGIVFFYNFAIGLTLIILAIALAYPTKAPIDESRTNLSCNNPASDFDEGTCYVLDFFKFFVVVLFLGVGMYVITKIR